MRKCHDRKLPICSTGRRSLWDGMSIMSNRTTIDLLDAQLLLALNREPRATVLSLAMTVGAARNTVQARMARFERSGVLAPFERRIEPAAIGYPMMAVITIKVTQRRLDDLAQELARIPEIIEVMGISGQVDLIVRVVAKDADDLYRIAGQVLAMEGIERTETGLVMRRLVEYRTEPLLQRAVLAT
jgi:DNA-binding Lrp family transcriptional regulator